MALTFWQESVPRLAFIAISQMDASSMQTPGLSRLPLPVAPGNSREPQQPRGSQRPRSPIATGIAKGVQSPGMDTGHQSIARAEHPPVGAEMVQRRRDRSGFFGKMLVTHTDKYTGTKRIVPVFLSRRGRLVEGQLPGGRAGIPGSGHRGAKLRPPGNCVFKPRSSSALEVRSWGWVVGNYTSLNFFVREDAGRER